ncbi:MAG: histidine utilization repressor [Betaproteobacteria bacterium RIFCSPLOWO2_12_FULL_64_23]|nr:MAG: histidine utilization repressor [Betaproteobacteria bacterium RIFCSPLOWO2_12_FULL_64_23]
MYSGKPKTAEKKRSRNADLPSFQQIKNYILQHIHAGEWKEGDQIPTEAALGQQFGVARMTVNRALRELASEQSVNRIQGLGTYVAQHKYQSTLVAIRNIADEVRGRGDRHACTVVLLESIRAPAALARSFDARRGIRLFHSILVHFENEIRIQVEDRWVNAALAPDYLSQDFAHSTPNEYLMRVAPLQGVSYRIEAKLPPAETRKQLAMRAGEPCLVLYRTTRSLGMVASVATMWHPASRYQFTGAF